MILSAKKNKTTTTVGVDIDADSVAAVQPAQGSGAPQGAVVPLPAGAYSGGEIADVDAVAAALRELFGREKLGKRVRLAVASQSVAFRSLRLPLIEDPEQLKAAVRFQAQEQIPMPLESAVLDHQVIGAQVADDGSRQVDVAVVAARRQSIDLLLAVARGAGLELVGIDLAAFGMIRALAATASRPGAELAAAAGPETEEYVPATLYCGLGGVTNLAIARDYSCLFSRVAEFSARGIAEELAGTTGLQLEHAEQWLVHAGLEQPVEEISGDPETVAAARGALESNLGRLADELRLSLDYYGALESAVPVGEVVLCGWGSTIPGLPAQLGAVLGREVSVRRPPALAAADDAWAARLTLPYGLALER
ncbi:MAG TPA: pilus assembly protein PilM [Solirubrobacterales bacterium]|nr:pilus assembly protein PilM [Solirubrobacterales bacterium]